MDSMDRLAKCHGGQYAEFEVQLHTTSLPRRLPAVERVMLKESALGGTYEVNSSIGRSSTHIHLSRDTEAGKVVARNTQ